MKIRSQNYIINWSRCAKYLTVDPTYIVTHSSKAAIIKKKNRYLLSRKIHI